MQKTVHTGGDTWQLQEDNDVVNNGTSLASVLPSEPSMTLVYRTKYNCNPYPVT